MILDQKAYKSIVIIVIFFNDSDSIQKPGNLACYPNAQLSGQISSGSVATIRELGDDPGQKPYKHNVTFVIFFDLGLTKQ